MIKSYLLAALLLTGIAVNGQEHKCATERKLEELKAQDPGLAQRMQQQEQQLQSLIASNAANKQAAVVTRIPVVVHVLYTTSAQNISFAQIQSQITVLNKDFRKLNSDTNNIPSGFKPLAGDAQIEFCLATRDPNGNYTTGVTRTSTSVNQIGNTNSYYSTAQGGQDAWDRNRYLNIWVCNIDGGNTLGFAYYPGSAPPSYDGVVIDYRYFGTMGTATPPYNLGRTATHEIGHWLNLAHIWGDAVCGNDFVNDTPPQEGPTFGCANYPSFDQCTGSGNGIMFTNYMDYSDDNCMNMFSNGQCTRMSTAIAGMRTGLMTSNGCSAPTSMPEEIAAPMLYAYPNPFSNSSTVHLQNALTNGTLDIYDVTGRKVQHEAQLEGASITIERNGLGAGIYFFQLWENGRSAGKGKLIIE